MIDKTLITTKLKDIKTYLMEIEPILEFPIHAIIKDYLKLRTLERDFQLIVDAMIEINTHLISRLHLAVSDDYQSTFETLGENNVIPADFALKIAPVVGLRNKVVHKYGQVDKKQMIEELKAGSEDFKDFIRVINEYIQVDAEKIEFYADQKEHPSASLIQSLKEAEMEIAQGKTIDFQNSRDALDYVEKLMKK